MELTPYWTEIKEWLSKTLQTAIDGFNVHAMPAPEYMKAATILRKLGLQRVNDVQATDAPIEHHVKRRGLFSIEDIKGDSAHIIIHIEIKFP